jgi:integrase
VSIKKPRKPGGPREVWVYDARVGKKVYVGSRVNLRGEGGARELELAKMAEFAGAPTEPVAVMTCDEYADRWLAVKHGDGTRREAPGTRTVNKNLLKPFREDFGDRPLRAGVDRVEALDWARQHQTNAKAVSAMFNDALDEMLTEANPFGNRRLPDGRGRKDIVPLTEAEVVMLAEAAEDTWGRYGVVVAGWITFLAWVGSRPKETFAVAWTALDLSGGRVTVQRVKGKKQTETIVLPPTAVAAIGRMPGPRSGLLFETAQGASYDKGSWGYYWRPVRAAFVASLPPARRTELQAVKGALDPYALRHFCGSLMADRGLSEFDIAHQLGNSPEVCRETYIHTHVDRANDRVALALAAGVADLSAHRRKRGA